VWCQISNTGSCYPLDQYQACNSFHGVWVGKTKEKSVTKGDLKTFVDIQYQHQLTGKFPIEETNRNEFVWTITQFAEVFDVFEEYLSSIFQVTTTSAGTTFWRLKLERLPKQRLRLFLEAPHFNSSDKAIKVNANFEILIINQRLTKKAFSSQSVQAIFTTSANYHGNNQNVISVNDIEAQGLLNNNTLQIALQLYSESIRIE